MTSWCASPCQPGARRRPTPPPADPLVPQHLGLGRGRAQAPPERIPDTAARAAVAAEHPTLGRYRLVAEGAPDLLFVENETNVPRIFGVPASTRFPKDGINDFVVHGRAERVNPAAWGPRRPPTTA